jgi:hypothetical protein
MKRLTISIDQDADPTKEARKICDFLFERCSGNVAEAAVLGFLRRAQEERRKFPWTKRADSDALAKAADAAGA